MRFPTLAISALALALIAAPLQARETTSTSTIPPSGVMGVGDEQLTPAYWIGLQKQPDRMILDRPSPESGRYRCRPSN